MAVRGLEPPRHGARAAVLNILFLVEGAEIGGGEADVLRLAAGLSERGHRAVVGAPGRALLDEARARGYTALCMPRSANLPGAVRAVARACREHAIDLVSAYGMRMTLAAGLARRLRLARAPLVTTIRDLSERASGLRARLVLQRLPDEAIFASRFERDRIAERWGGAAGQVIHPWVDVPRPGSIEPIDLESKHGVPRDARVIGYLGALSPEKAVGDVIAALVRLPEDVYLCIVGEGSEEGALRAEARRRGVERRVVFAGASSEVERYMIGLSALVLPSRQEALPVSLLEAAALAIPVIAADVGGVREIVDPRETGLLYPTGDVDGLVRAIRGILDDPSRAATLGCAARERVARVFAAQRFVDETEALFARVARAD
ncbi:MAG: glycosyltransferase family 4 protein [Myxococcota bacterium]